MILAEALIRAHRDRVIVEIDSIDGLKKQVRSKNEFKYAEFEQRLQRIDGLYNDWNNSAINLSVEQIDSSEWSVCEEEKGMGFCEALMKLLEGRDGSVMYQEGNNSIHYRLLSNFSLEQRRNNNRWDGTPIEFTECMLTQKDWVVKSATEEGKTDSNTFDDADCGHESCRQLRSSWIFRF